jgi:hypothetical protein
MVAMGTRVYLACTTDEELVDGHCLIVPIQHHLTMLEGDDDVWDEVKVRPSAPCIRSPFTHLDPEFHEMSHSHVRRRGQRCHLLRDGNHT